MIDCGEDAAGYWESANMDVTCDQCLSIEGTIVAEKFSEASPIRSQFGGGWISRSQALAEDACRRLALKNKEDLWPGFWRDPRWERTFLLQLRHANVLLKSYPHEAVAAALRTPEGRRCFSLSARWLDPLIKAEVEKLARREEAAATPGPAPVAAVREAPRPAFVPSRKQGRGLDG